MNTQGYNRYGTLLMMSLGHFTVDFMIGIWAIYKMVAELDLAMAGFIAAFGALLGESTQLIFGSYSDRGYRKHLIIFGVVVATSSAFFVYSKSYLVLFILYLLTCIGSAAFHPSAAGLVSHLMPSRRAFFMTIFTAAGFLGLSASQMTFVSALNSWEGHTAFLAIPAIFLGVCLLGFHLPKMNPKNSERKIALTDFTHFFKRENLRLLYFSQVANGTIMWGMIFLLPNVLKTLGHSDWICLGGGHLCFVLGSALMMIPGGYLADKFSPRNVLFLSNCIACVLLYAFLFFGGISALLTIPLLWLLGASLGVANPVSVAMGNQLVPDQPGTVSAFLMGFVWCVSEFLGPGGGGLLSTLFADGGPVKALAILGLFFTVSIYATYALPRSEMTKSTKLT